MTFFVFSLSSVDWLAFFLNNNKISAWHDAGCTFANSAVSVHGWSLRGSKLALTYSKKHPYMYVPVPPSFPLLWLQSRCWTGTKVLIWILDLSQSVLGAGMRYKRYIKEGKEWWELSDLQKGFIMVIVKALSHQPTLIALQFVHWEGVNVKSNSDDLVQIWFDQKHRTQ